MSSARLDSRSAGKPAREVFEQHRRLIQAMPNVHDVAEHQRRAIAAISAAGLTRDELLRASQRMGKALDAALRSASTLYPPPGGLPRWREHPVRRLRIAYLRWKARR